QVHLQEEDQRSGKGDVEMDIIKNSVCDASKDSELIKDMLPLKMIPTVDYERRDRILKHERFVLDFYNSDDVNCFLYDTIKATNIETEEERDWFSAWLIPMMVEKQIMMENLCDDKHRAAIYAIFIASCLTGDASPRFIRPEDIFVKDGYACVDAEYKGWHIEVSCRMVGKLQGMLREVVEECGTIREVHARLADSFRAVIQIANELEAEEDELEESDED
ncbi:MAG: hypothetical protein K2F99_01330, partial [Muribaculaceae bacterium]|nr:hypothetical protein [Muribaculaceae bacterium]